MLSIGEYEYCASEVVGHGAYGIVYKGRHKKTNTPMAVKVINRNYIYSELTILRELAKFRHKNLVTLNYSTELLRHIYLIMEYCNGGDLGRYLKLKKTLSEKEIKIFLRQIAAAMKILNANGIIHRDLKPQNILLSHTSTAGLPTIDKITFKIADFGISRFVKAGGAAHTICGTPLYMAPEVAFGLQYTAKVDLWSIGIIVYELANGKPLLYVNNINDVVLKFKRSNQFPFRFSESASQKYQNLVTGLLRYDANDRMSFDEFFQHPFIKSRRKMTKEGIEAPKEDNVKVVQKVKIREAQPIVNERKEVVIVKAPPPVPPKPRKPQQIIVKSNDVNLRPKQAVLPIINDNMRRPNQFEPVRNFGVQPQNGNNNLVKLKVHVVHVKKEETKVQKVVK